MKIRELCALLAGIFSYIFLKDHIGFLFSVIIGISVYNTIDYTLKSKEEKKLAEAEEKRILKKGQEKIDSFADTKEADDFGIKKTTYINPDKMNNPDRIKIKLTDDEMELKEIMDTAYGYLLDIRRGYKRAKHESIMELGESLYTSGVKIFEHLNNNPKKIRQSRRYLDYYLEMASKIMCKYTTFLDTGLNSEEVLKVFQETEKALRILNDAFEKQFTKLLRNDMMEVEANVKVLEETFKLDNY